MDWKLRVSDQAQVGAIEIFIFREIPNGRIEYVSNLSGKIGMEVTMIDKGAKIEPCITLEWGCHQLLQAISDGLFDFGIRPTQEPVLKNEMSATKYHLEDIREVLSIALGQKEGGSFGAERKDGNGITCRPSG